MLFICLFFLNIAVSMVTETCYWLSIALGDFNIVTSLVVLYLICVFWDSFESYRLMAPSPISISHLFLLTPPVVQNHQLKLKPVQLYDRHSPSLCLKLHFSALKTFKQQTVHTFVNFVEENAVYYSCMHNSPKFECGTSDTSHNSVNTILVIQ